MPDAVFIDGAALVAIVAAFAAAIRSIIRITKVIDGQLGAMQDNTKAVNQLTDIMGPLHEQVTDHEHRLNIIEPAVFPDGTPHFRTRRA